jgi:hypothetical protein
MKMIMTMKEKKRKEKAVLMAMIPVTSPVVVKME